MIDMIIILASLAMLIMGTLIAYKKFGLKRVLLGKTNDHLELIYYNNGKISWKPTLKSWKIILTGGMSLLSIFLLIMLLILAGLYAKDINAQKQNDEIFCQKYGTVYPTEEQLKDYNNWIINPEETLRNTNLKKPDTNQNT